MHKVAIGRTIALLTSYCTYLCIAVEVVRTIPTRLLIRYVLHVLVEDLFDCFDRRNKTLTVEMIPEPDIVLVPGVFLSRSCQIVGCRCINSLTSDS